MCLLFGTVSQVSDVAHGSLFKKSDWYIIVILLISICISVPLAKILNYKWYTVCFPVFFHEETHDFISEAKTKQGAEACMEFALWRGTVRNYPGKYDTKEAHQCLSGDVMIYFYLICSCIFPPENGRSLSFVTVWMFIKMSLIILYYFWFCVCDTVKHVFLHLHWVSSRHFNNIYYRYYENWKHNHDYCCPHRVLAAIFEHVQSHW